MKNELKIKLNLCDIVGGIEKYRSPEQKREIHKKNLEVVFKWLNKLPQNLQQTE